MDSDQRVYMAGMEWHGSLTGGLNRYFESLFLAMRASAGDRVQGVAFGNAPSGGLSWGPVGQPALQRLSTLKPVRSFGAGDVIDRHFCLYGPNPGIGSKRPAFIAHFQGPWAAESAVAGHNGLSVKVKYLVERLRYARVDHFVVLSQRFADLLTADYHVRPDRVSVIAPGVDLERFEVAPPSGRHDVLCVRRLERRMGIDNLIAGWPAVRAEIDDARLVIVGSGTDEARLKELAAATSNDGSIVFRGRVSDEELVDLYTECALTVIPSIALEGFGLIALESLAVGRVPVVTDCGGLPDAVVGLDPTLVVPPNDSIALAERIVTALKGDVPSAEAARRHAEKFSWAKVADKHFDLYASLR